MKKRIFYILVILVSLSIPFYAMFIWEPGHDINILKSIFYSSKEVINTNIAEENIENETKIENEKVETNNNIEEIKKKIKKEDITKIKVIFNKISTVDQNKIFQWIDESKYDYSVSTKIIDLMKKRLGNEDYEELKAILQNYISID